MADDQLAGTGHRGQFWLSTDGTEANLERMNQVVSFGLPKQTRDFIETTHLDSDGKEYAPTLPDFEEFDVVLNYRPGSDTDLALIDASEDDVPRAMYLAIPVRGVLTRQYSGLGYISYDPGEVTVDGKMESTVTIRPSGAWTPAAYVAP